MPQRIFVSHSSCDREAAERIAAYLEGNGLECWIAPRDIPPGADWVEAIIDGIDAASGMLLVVSDSSNRSPQVRRELERAVSRGLELVSVILEQVEFSKWMQYYTSTHQRCDATVGGLQQYLPRILDSFRDTRGGVSADMSNLSSLLEEDIGRLASSIEFEEGRALKLESGERRRASVLSLNVTPPETAGLGSHPLAGRRIAETLGAMVRRVVEAFGGHLETFEDYRYRCVFGLERALEDDAHRAVSSAVRLFNGLGEMNRVLRGRGLVLDFTMGAATGVLEVAAGRGDSFEPTGEPLQEADLLASGAPRNELLVTPGLWRICRERWQFEEAECEVLEDCRRLADYSIVPVEGRVLQVRAPMVGRDSELARLDRLLDRQAAAGGSRNRRGGARHHVVGVRGEAGIGKSRLVHEFLQRSCSNEDDVEVLRGRTLSYAQPPNWIWTSLIRSRLGLSRSSALDYGELLRRLARIDDGEELMGSAPFLAELLGIDAGGEAEAPDRESLALEQRVAVRNLVAALAGGSRLVVVLDDLHRMDGASRKILEFLIGNCDLEVPLVFLLVYRPERDDGCEVEFDILPGYAHLEEMSLQPLGRRACGELLELLLEDIGTAGEVSPEARGLLLDSARGIPLFLEELVMDLVETGVLRQENGSWTLSAADADARIPHGLRNLLQSRLDRLPADWRNVIQSASVLGSEFPLGLYRCFARRVFGRDPETRILDELQDRGLISCEKSAFGGTYRFGSKLLCSSAYESILESNLRLLHRAAAESVEEYYPDDDERAPGMLMHHWERAGDTSRALRWGRQALKDAAGAYENETVLELSGKLEGWLQDEPEGPERTEALCRILLVRSNTEGLMGRGKVQERDLARALELVEDAELPEVEAKIKIAAGNYCVMAGRHDEAEGHFRRVKEIGDRLDLSHYRAHGLEGLADLASLRGKPGEALELRKRALETFEEIDDTGGRGNALVNTGVLLHKLGRLQEAGGYYSRAMDLSSMRGGRKLRAVVLVNMGILHSNLDRLDEAMECYRRAVEIFRTIGFTRGEAAAQVNLGIIHRERGRLEKALECFSQSLAIEREAGDRNSECISLINLGSVRFTQGDMEGALELYSRSLGISRETGNRRVEGVSLSSVASVYRETGRHRESMELLDEAREILEELGERKMLAESVANMGLLHCETGRLEEATACYREAADIIGDLGTGRHDSEVTVDLRKSLLAKGCPEGDLPLPEHWE